MTAHGCARVLTEADCSRLHDAVLRVLDELGMRLEHPVLLREMAEFGFRVDVDRQVVHFDRDRAEALIAGMGGHELALTPDLRFNASGFVSHYLEPERDELRPHTVDSHHRFMNVCDGLEHITSLTMQGLPSDVPRHLLNLRLKVLSVCWTEKPYHSGEIEFPAEIPFFQEICNLYEAERGLPPNSTANVNLWKLQPLRFDAARSEMMLALRAHGLASSMGGIAATMGLNAPVTPAGAAVMALAAQFSSLLFNHASEVVRGLRDPGDFAPLSLTANVCCADMRTGHVLISRPEAWRANLMLAAMARFYGASSLTYGGCKTQAKTIASVQSAAERFADMLTGFHAGATTFYSLGSIGEPQGLSSAVQLVIDNELAGILKFLARAVPMTEAYVGVEAILDQGHDPQFLASSHTAAHFRETTWRPDLFLGGDTYDQWLARGGRTEVDAARERALELWQREPRLVVSEACHEAMLAVLEKASRTL